MTNLPPKNDTPVSNLDTSKADAQTKHQGSPSRDTRVQIIKWLSIGVVGVVFSLVAGAVAIMWMFTPLFHIDEKSGRAQILGGLIDLSQADVESVSPTEEGKAGEGTTKYSLRYNFKEQEVHAGGMSLDSQKAWELQVPFKDGALEFQWTNDQNLKWRCSTSSLEQPQGGLLNEKTPEKLVLALDVLGGFDCQIRVPTNVRVSASGSSGRVRVLEPRSAIEVKLAAGSVEFAPLAGQAYELKTQVSVGQSDDFSDLPSIKGAKLPIRLSVEAGQVRRL